MMRYLSADQVITIHERVIASGELQGLAQNKSNEAVIGRIENRLAYGLIADLFELAACYACYIAVGHCFHDANERTAHTAMQIVLKLNGFVLEYDVEQLGTKIILAAQGLVDEEELATYLRSLPFKDQL